MTWTKLSDDFADDCWSLTDAAHRLHVEGLGWSNRKLLDCRIPVADVRRFKTPEAVAELLACGWWSEDGDHYRIRHHAGYQRSRADVVAQQATNRRNGARGGRPRKPQQVDTETQSQTEAVSRTQSQTEALTETDGTGRAYTGSEVDATWPEPVLCEVCRGPLPMRLVETEGWRSHPGCDAA